jgi:hypothetical protein
VFAKTCAWHCRRSADLRCALWSIFAVRIQFAERCIRAERAHRLHSDVHEWLLNPCKGYKDSFLSACLPPAASCLTTARPMQQPQMVRWRTSLCWPGSSFLRCDYVFLGESQDLFLWAAAHLIWMRSRWRNAAGLQRHGLMNAL